MTYRQHEIYARVCGSYSDLLELDDDGNLAESMDVQIMHDDQQVVWYEVEGVDPETGMLDSGMQCKTIAEAKAAVDRSIEYNKRHP